MKFLCEWVYYPLQQLYSCVPIKSISKMNKI
nr:MAG TPA: hypothetical protein [Inoviridae sp.]